jgi:alkanesulfonate monooxygenase
MFVQCVVEFGRSFTAPRCPQYSDERYARRSDPSGAAREYQPGSVVPRIMMTKTAGVGSNGGTAAGLVGSYAQVAERIMQFGEVGIELFMLQFQPFEAEMRRFTAEVMPRVSWL